VLVEIGPEDKRRHNSPLFTLLPLKGNGRKPLRRKPSFDLLLLHTSTFAIATKLLLITFYFDSYHYCNNENLNTKSRIIRKQ
jgi:hypothetical protein